MSAAFLVVVLGALARPYGRWRRSHAARRPRTTPTPPPRHRPRSLGARRRRRTHADDISSALPDAIELVVLAVRAGALPAAAITAVVSHVPPSVSPAFQAVQQAVSQGVRFADAVQSLPQLLGPGALPLADTLAAADRDGLPLAPVLDRLAMEARLQRRRHADTLARQLPVRLSLPLVLCTLPSFVLLAVAPLLLAALSSLHR